LLSLSFTYISLSMWLTHFTPTLFRFLCSYDRSSKPQQQGNGKPGTDRATHTAAAAAAPSLSRHVPAGSKRAGGSGLLHKGGVNSGIRGFHKGGGKHGCVFTAPCACWELESRWENELHTTGGKCEIRGHKLYARGYKP